MTSLRWVWYDRRDICLTGMPAFSGIREYTTFFRIRTEWIPGDAWNRYSRMIYTSEYIICAKLCVQNNRRTWRHNSSSIRLRDVTDQHKSFCRDTKNIGLENAAKLVIDDCSHQVRVFSCFGRLLRHRNPGPILLLWKNCTQLKWINTRDTSKNGCLICRQR